MRYCKADEDPAIGPEMDEEQLRKKPSRLRQKPKEERPAKESKKRKPTQQRKPDKGDKS